MTGKTNPLATRRIVLAFWLILALGLAVAASMPRPAEAAHVDCYYYSDATFTVLVGASGVDCCGNPIDWGVTSPYVRCEPVPVCIWCPPPSE
jgi:Family of unknown function (DUF6289)